MKANIEVGYLVGLGAAINVPCGFIPDRVQVYNLTDGSIYTEAFLGRWNVPFTSGGTNTISAGDKIIGATSGATAIVESVLLASGTWAAGNAAGFLILQDGSLNGTFGSENVYDLTTQAASGIDDATVTVNVALAIKTDTAAASVTGNNALSRLEGAAAAAAGGQGFIIGSAVATAAKLLYWEAVRRTE